MKSQSPLLSSTASVSSFQSFETIRQAPSTVATSIACSDDHRWSEVVPPESGLTFAVVWNPEEKDILTFSTAGFSESSRNAQSPDSPSDACDNRSQVLTIGPSVVPPSENTATLQFFRENHDFLFGESTLFPNRPMRGRTQTSSTLDGLDVYLRGSMLGKAHNANRYYSCFQELDTDFAFDPRTSFANMWMQDSKREIRDDVSDEGFFEGGQFNGMDDENEGNMSSAFSVTTTSTSNYITVENEMDDESSSTWSALEAPNTPSHSRLLFTGTPPATRRLRKARPVPAPASPSDVLDRSDYSHNLPVPAPGTPENPRASTLCQRHLSLPKFVRGRKKTKTAAGWVWIDVKGESHTA
ncbi:hypothetical protein C8R44DRAFT_976185 [Mycena epipterygia]|nr:hypothetical protein C8R44DRAFT_976185 [Mycena epipterygia]